MQARAMQSVNTIGERGRERRNNENKVRGEGKLLTYQLSLGDVLGGRGGKGRKGTLLPIRST